jgi:hypothetical protein
MTRRAIEFVALFVSLLIAAFAFHAWLDARDEQHRLQITLATQKQLLDAADSREKDRNAALATTLAQIAKLKSSTQTPQEIVRALQEQLSLPQPITLSASNPASVSRSAVFTPSDARGPRPSPLPSPSSLSPPSQSPPSAQQGTAPSQNSPPATPSLPAQQNLPDAPSAQIPSADLKPLFDYAQNCRACQAQLAAAQQNSADDSAKIAALTRERDAAITASKGGTFLRRLRRNALWFVAGAAAGYAAAKR